MGTYNQRVASKANGSTVKDIEELLNPKNLLVAVRESWPRQTAPALKPKRTTRLGKERSPQQRKDLRERIEM